MALHLHLLLFSSAILLLLLGAANSDNRRMPLILPLSLSPRNSSFPDRYHQRRHLHSSQLHKKPSARMRLYDDLLTNGYYTTRLYIGTPPQEFALIVDTGSTVTYVPCSNCVQCGNHQDPRFKPELSSTYQPHKCNAQCNCDSEGKQCTYERRYAEMSSSSGVLGNDIVSFGNESVLSPQRAEFGCETEETGDLFNQRADGIMGLGRGRISIVNQLVEKGVVDDSFSLCYGGMGIGGGAMILGRVPPPPNMVFSPSDPHRSPYYNIELKEIHVAGKPLKLNPSTFNGKHGTVLDSGTTYAYLPAKAFVAFKDAIMKSLDSLKQIDGPDPNYEDICFAGAGGDVTRLSDSFPEVDMVFRNKQKLALTPENYLFRHSKVPGAYCLGIFKNENDETTLLGGILVRNTLVTYDREKNKIGFWKTNCSELWKRLQDSGAPAPAPAHVVPQKNESSSASPPTMPPSGSSESIFSGKFHVGLITFEMSFNSNTKPNFTELAQFIASELGIDASQVKLLNFTSQGNHSHIKWAISPAKSENFISNSTAVSIIGQLKDHHVQLPERFGSYELVEWKIEPQKKQTWWQHHGLVVVAAVVVTVLLCLSMFGMWFVWRNNRDAFIGYKPVDSTVPEQELQLQPL